MTSFIFVLFCIFTFVCWSNVAEVIVVLYLLVVLLLVRSILISSIIVK